MSEVNKLGEGQAKKRPRSERAWPIQRNTKSLG